MRDSEFILELIKRAQESHQRLLDKTLALIALKAEENALRSEIYHLNCMLELEKEAENIRSSKPQDP